MIHARRIKPKRNNTKEMLERTVVPNSRAQKVSLEEAQDVVTSSAVTSGAETLASASQQGEQKVNAFDAVISKKKPFSRLTQARKNRNNRTRKNTKAQDPMSNQMPNPMRKFFKRLAYLAIFCVLAFALLSLSFRTETVIVQGNNQLSPSEVQALSKIHAGTPLLWVSERNIKNLLRNPWVDNVKINREFPHTVLIELRERTPVALLSINIGEQVGGEPVAGGVHSQASLAAFSADGLMLPNVPVEVLNSLTPINGWGEDRSLEGLELFNYLSTMPELSVTKIDYTPEGFEASFEYGLQEVGSNDISFILGQLQVPSLTLLKEHWSAFMYALATNETGELRNMAGSLEDRFIVPASLASLVGEGQDNQETGRIVKRKWITIYGWGVSLSE